MINVLESNLFNQFISENKLVMDNNNYEFTNTKRLNLVINNIISSGFNILYFNHINDKNNLNNETNNFIYKIDEPLDNHYCYIVNKENIDNNNYYVISHHLIEKPV